jgi:hypothetical protein
VGVVSMSWPAPGTGWALVEGDGGNRRLVRTTDDGATWSGVTGPDVSAAQQVLFADATNGWIAGGSHAVSTHDGGVTWQPLSIAGSEGTAAVAAANGTVHVGFLRGAGAGLGIASSPTDHDAFVAAPLVIPFGAGPRLDVSMSAGGPYGELVYDDRVLTGAAEIRNGAWSTWDITCPGSAPTVSAALSPTGAALTIACAPSGFGDPGPLLGADLSGGHLAWTTIEPLGDESGGLPVLDAVAATDAGARIVGYTSADGSSHLAVSTDGGATWPTRVALPTGRAQVFAPVPGGGLLVATGPFGGMFSADGVSWVPVATGPVAA